MKLDVPYYSQRTDVTDPAWQSRACGVVCVAMVLAHRSGVTPSLDALILEGREIGAYRDGVGWVHDGLIALAGGHGLKPSEDGSPLGRPDTGLADRPEGGLGLKMHRGEFKGEGAESDERLKQGIEKIIARLGQGRLVLASVAKGFEDTTKPHLVLLTGTKGDEGATTGFYYHDPDAEIREAGMNQFVPLETFKRFWRRLAIFEGV